MKHQKPVTLTFHAAAIAGAFSLIAAATSQAAFVGTPLPSPTPPPPGAGNVLLGPVQMNDPGTVLAALDYSFVDNAAPLPFASGTLRTLVVDYGGGLDFYYQLVNTSVADPLAPELTDFYRMKVLSGFEPSQVLSVGQTDSLAGLVAGLGSGFVPGSYTTGASLQPATSADRDFPPLTSGVGFDFPIQPPPSFIGDPADIGAGETSTFLVVRTNAYTYGPAQMVISGAATGFASTFASIPEPSSMIFGLAMLGVAATRIRRRA